jgi:hypothetical protein
MARVTPHRGWPITRSAAAALAAAALAAAALLAGCSSSPAAVTLPPRPSPSQPVPSPHPSPSLDVEAQVTAAWDAFWVAGTTAERTQNVASAGADLAGTTAPSYITAVVSAMQADWKQHKVTWGHPVEHIIKVSIVPVGRAEAAFVTDCQDDSDTGLENAKTGKHIAGTTGAARAELIGTLGLDGSRWLVSNVTPIAGGKCTV